MEAGQTDQQEMANQQPADQQQMANQQPGADQQQADQQQMAAAGQNDMAAGDVEEITANEVRGMNVYNDAGEEIGTVDALMIRTDDNQGYLIIDHRGLLNFGEEKIAYPLADIRKDGDRLILSGLNNDEIADLPVWTEDDDAYTAVDDDARAVIQVTMQ